MKDGKIYGCPRNPTTAADMVAHDWVIEYDENSVAWVVSVQDSSVRRPLEHGQLIPILSYARQQVEAVREPLKQVDALLRKWWEDEDSDHIHDAGEMLRAAIRALPGETP